VLGLLVEMEPQQAAMLERVLNGPLLSVTALRDANALPLGAGASAGKQASEDSPQLF
jgi:hypothetical protein